MRIMALLLALAFACGSEADELGVGSECATTDDSSEDDQACLLQFAGGYCGIVDCNEDLDCPEDAACVTHDDNSNYCFRTCVDKSECNANRSVENESNCSSSVTFVDGADGRKACVPPSSGT